MTPKLSSLNIVLSYWNENMNQNFRFNNPKQFSNWIILMSFCSSHLVIKNWYNIHYENLKNRFLRKKFKKVCVLQRRACTQIQNFKHNYLKNYNDSVHAVKTKNASFFMIFPNISFLHMIVNFWTGPLNPIRTIIGILIIWQKF